MTKSFPIQAGNEALSASAVTMSETEKPTLLFLHGGGKSNKERALPIAKRIFELSGTPSLLFDFSGHGESSGALSDSSLEKRLSEAEAAFALLDAAKPAVLIGASMSGHIALELLKNHQAIGTVVLFCPAVYAADAFSLRFGDAAFTDTLHLHESWKKNDILESLASFTGNLLIFMGEDDKVIPKEVPQLIIDAASSAHKKELVAFPGIDHGLVKTIANDPELLESVSRKITDFINCTP